MSIEASIHENLASGRLLEGVRVIDAHAHVGRWPLFYVPDPSLPRIMDEWDRFGIGLSCVTSLLGFSVDMQGGNDEVLAAIRFAPDRFLGYICLVPHRPLDECRREVQRLMDASENFIGLKFHPLWNDYPVDGDRYKPLWDLAAERCPLILIHSWNDDQTGGPNPAGRIAKLAEQYPEVTVILGHGGGTRAGQLEAAACCRRLPNLYMDICGGEFGNYWLERLMEHAPADKVLFGTDVPFLGAGSSVGRVGYANIDDKTKRAIFGENMAGILKTKTRWGKRRPETQ
jgi:uncharacterized protein